jgi:hypothetical protein
VKAKYYGRRERRLWWCGGRRILLLGSQVSPPHPSDGSRMEIKILSVVRNSGLKQELQNFDYLN